MKKTLNRLFNRKEPSLTMEADEHKAADVLDLTKKAGNSEQGDWPNTLSAGGEVTGMSIQRSIDSFPVVNEFAAITGDSATVVGDSCGPSATAGAGAIISTGTVMSPALAAWYSTQGFIGHQMCAIIAQNWLVNKACSMPAEDAIRNGWTTDFKDVDDIEKIEELTGKLRRIDERMGLDKVMLEAAKFCNVFGIRILIPLVETNDKDYYFKKFNPDGITPGSFKGWVQIDPQWIYPLLSSVGASEPGSPEFYEPTYWQAGGKTYHRSHLVILRTEEVADVLKPSYLFSGLPLTQRIAERVYAAERTANEAPLLAMSKRTTVLKVDLAKAKLKMNAFVSRIQSWVGLRDNYQVKVINKDETMEESDTSLADLDTVIMTQYQIVAAIARVPATKLLGTSPKGFNATGEHEIKSYHEYLESIQSTWFDQFLERHYLLVSRSYMDGVKISHTWEPVDTIGAEAAAAIQKIKAETGQILINGGVISEDEERSRIRMDKESGYTLAEDSEAPGIPDIGGAVTPQVEAGTADEDVDGLATVDGHEVPTTVGNKAAQDAVVIALVMQIVSKLRERDDTRSASLLDSIRTAIPLVRPSVLGIQPSVLPTPPAHLQK